MAAPKKIIQTFYAVSLAWQLGFLIVLPLVGFVLLGVWLDRRLGSAPVMILGGLVIGLLVTGYEVYRLLLPLLHHADSDTPAADAPPPAPGRPDAV